MPAGRVHPLPPPSRGHTGPLGPPRSTTKYVISPRGYSPSCWLPSPRWLLTLPQGHKKLQSLTCPVCKAEGAPLHGCAHWAGLLPPNSPHRDASLVPVLLCPPWGPAVPRVSGAPPSLHRWAPAMCQPCPRMETWGQWVLPLPSRGSSLVGGTVRCFTHKNSTQHLLTPPVCKALQILTHFLLLIFPWGAHWKQTWRSSTWDQILPQSIDIL